MKINFKSINFWLNIIFFTTSIGLGSLLIIKMNEKTKVNNNVIKSEVIKKNYDKNVSYLDKLANTFQNQTYFVSSQNKTLNNTTQKEILRIMKAKEPNLYFPSSKFIKIISDEKTVIGNKSAKVNIKISKNNIERIMTINVKRIPFLQEANDLPNQEIYKKIYTIDSKFKKLNGDATVALRKVIEKDIKKIYPNKNISVYIRNNLNIPWKNPIIKKLVLGPQVKIGQVYYQKDVVETSILFKRLPTLNEANGIPEQNDIKSSNKKINYKLVKQENKSEFVSSFSFRLGNKQFTDQENKLEDWGLKFNQVFPNKSIAEEKELDISLKYVDYEFSMKKINAVLIWKENGIYKGKNILVKGFLDPKIKVDDEQEIYDQEFKNLILPNTFKIPETINKISHSAFRRTILPENWDHPKAWKEEIPESAYYAAKIPKSFIIPTSVKKINDRAFQNSRGYLPKTIPSSVTKIGIKVFKNSEGKIPFIPNSVKELGYSVFFGHTLPKNWVNPAAWKTTIPKFGYVKVTFQDRFKIPDSVTKIGYAAFGEAKLSNNFELSKNLSVIDQFAFYKAEGKISKIPDSIKEVSWTAFDQFKGTAPSIPKNAKRIR